MSTGWNSFFTLRLIAPILLFLPIPPIIKIVLLYLTDTLDCKFYKLMVDSTYDSTKFGYQMYDKLMDMYTESLILLYILSFKIVHWSYFPYLMTLFILRVIGVLFYTNTRKTIYLKVFADAFREFTIFILLLRYFPNASLFVRKNIPMFAGLIYAGKVLFECFWHKEETTPE